MSLKKKKRKREREERKNVRCFVFAQNVFFLGFEGGRGERKKNKMLLESQSQQRSLFFVTKCDLARHLHIGPKSKT